MQKNPGFWKGALASGLVVAAAAFGGPIAGKAVGFIVPKALEHVSDTPISDLKAHENPFSKEKITHEPKEVTLRFTLQERETLRRVLGPEWTPTGKMFCRTEAP